jgi:hypothetical protein
MYLPNISNSTLTVSFNLKFFRLVSLSVCGIIFKIIFLLEILEIVKETPLIEIEAFSSKCFINFLFLNSSFKIHELSTNKIFLTLAVVST